MSAAQVESIGPGRLVLVVGPSGAGKDTLISGVKTACAADRTIVFPRRVVTRPVNASEDHDSLDDAAFDRAIQSGAFAFWWQAHGLKYGIPRSVDEDIRAGRTVVCNVTRGIVDALRKRYAQIVVILVTAPTDVLAARLSGRLRQSDGSLADRIERNDAYAGFRADHVIDNVGTPDTGVRHLFDTIQT